MRIEGNTIVVKSDDNSYFKEEAGIKPNKVRFFHDFNERREIENFCKEMEEEVKYIEVHNSMSPYLFFRRQLRDISQVHDIWGGANLCYVFSWFHEEDGTQKGFNAPVR